MSEAQRAPSRVQARRFNRVEEIAAAYLIQADGNPSLALRRAVRDALADLSEMERLVHADTSERDQRGPPQATRTTLCRNTQPLSRHTPPDQDCSMLFFAARFAYLSSRRDPVGRPRRFIPLGFCRPSRHARYPCRRGA